MRGRQRGVTLVEMAVALAVTAILVGGAVPTVGAALEGYRATGATAVSTPRSTSRRPAPDRAA